MGRPLKNIDAAEVERLAAAFCTNEEMAWILGCCADTLTKRFSDAIEKGRAMAKSSLRRKQWELAQNGDRTMLIWLGKQWLGQQDKQVVENQGDQTIRVVVEYADDPSPAE